MLGNSDTLQSSCPSGICNTSYWYNFSFFLQCTLHWIMKESLIMSLYLKVWDVFRLILMVLGSTTLHQYLTIFLPGELSHSLVVSTTGRWMWQAVATGPLDFVMTLGHETVTWSLTQREFFYFFVSERTISAVALPLPTITSICQKDPRPCGGGSGLWRWCRELCECGQKFYHLQFPLLLLLFSSQTFSMLWLPMIKGTLEIWKQVSEILITGITNLFLYDFL